MAAQPEHHEQPDGEEEAAYMNRAAAGRVEGAVSGIEGLVHGDGSGPEVGPEGEALQVRDE
jgi:hypothetical protein